MKIRVGLIDDDKATRTRLTQMLQGEPSIEFTAACAGTVEALRMLPPLAPDVVLVDILMPKGDSGIESVRQLRPLMPFTEFMMLSVVEDGEDIFASLRFGATGYLLKTSSPAEIIQGIKDLHAQGSPMTPSIARKVLQEFTRMSLSKDPVNRLTQRETAVLRALCRGHLYKEVAEELGISPSTVRGHINKIYRKLEVKSRAEAVSKATQFWKKLFKRRRKS